MSCPSVTTCYAVSDVGTILATTNGGVTWAIQPSGTAYDLNGVSCPSAATCFAVGVDYNSSGWQDVILATSNGGASWTTQVSSSNSYPGLYGVSCPSTTTCYAVGGGTIFVTTTGGVIWTSQQADGVPVAVSCPNVTTCYAVGSYGTESGYGIIEATTNGGATWTTEYKYTGSGWESLTGVSCPSATTCYAVGVDGQDQDIILSTTNGSTWFAQSPGTSRGLSSVSCPSITTCYAVGGDIVVTTNGGATWTKQSSSSGGNMVAVGCPDLTSCYAVGGYTILVTSNGGSTWTQQSSSVTTNNLYGVSCPRITTCYAVGGNSILVTTNGGSRWSSSTSYYELAGASCPNTTTCYAVGGYGVGGVILSTTNGGATWSEEGGAQYPLASVSCPSTSTCYAVGQVGTLIATTDGGATWTPLSSGISDDMSSVSCPSVTTCYLVAGRYVNGSGVNLIVNTTNGGRTWTTLFNDTGGELDSVSCPSVTTCYTVGLGRILTTSNGGATWTPQAGISDNWDDISCPNSTTCYAVGGAGIQVTTNGGAAWTDQSFDTDNYLRGVSCPSTTTCYAVGDYGTILATTTGGVPPSQPSTVCVRDPKVPQDEQFCSQVPSSTSLSPQVTVDVTRYYGSVCSKDDPYAIDPADCQDTQSNHLATGVYQGYTNKHGIVTGFGAFGTAYITVSATGNISNGTTVLVNGQQATGSWNGSQFTGLIPTATLIFPNLDVPSSSSLPNSTQPIEPPYPANNIVRLDNVSGGGATINWARLEVLGTRPVILVHGIILSLSTIANLLNPISPLPTLPPDELNGWNTWLDWVGPVAADGSGAGFLRRIGVPNVRPDEDISTAATATASAMPCGVDSTTYRLPSIRSETACRYKSDVRAYTWPYASYTENAAYLLDMVNMLKTRYGVDRVNIVGYSKGTQDVEEAVREAPASFEQVILLAPMYAGTSLADAFQVGLGHAEGVPSICKSLIGSVLWTCMNANYLANVAAKTLSTVQPALDEMTTTYWRNARQRLLYGVALNRHVVTVAGTGGCNLIPTPIVGISLGGPTEPIGFGWICNPIAQIPQSIANDGAVPMWSVDQVPNAIAIPPVGLGHLDLPHASAQVFYQVSCALAMSIDGVPIILSSSHQMSRPNDGQLSVPANRMGNNVASTGAAPGTAYGPGSVMFLPPGATADVPIAMPSSSSATSSVMAPNSLAFSLINPTGMNVDGSSTGVSYADTTLPDGTTQVAYTIANPASGTWTAVITNTATVTTTAILSDNFATTLQLTPGVPAVSAPGATFPITATLTDGQTPINGATITATVLLSNTNPLQTMLSDQGSGNYSGSVTLPITATNSVEVGLEAAGTDSGTPFDLTNDASSQVTSGQASFSSTYGEQAIDSTGDGLYDSLVITPTVTAQQTGDYQLSGDLTDGSGNLIASATNALTLTGGIATPITLTFDGSTIAKSGVNGPYHLSNLTLYDLNADAPTASLTSAYTTAAYQASQFEHPPVSIGSTLTDAGGAPNPSGLYQTLDVTATVQVDATGAYSVGALLIDSTGAPITSTVQSVTLGPNPTPVVLHFPGVAIAAHGVNGPYQVVGFTVTAANGIELADVDTLETTQAYTSGQFAPAIQTAAVSAASGWNLITLPLSPTVAISASTILAGVLQTSHGSLAAIYGLSKNQWSSSLIQPAGDNPIGHDFTLQPGQGYLLYSDKTGSYTESGAVPNTPLAWVLNPGWNLVGMSAGATGVISASTVLKGVLKQSDSSLVAIYGLSNNQWSPSLIQPGSGNPIGQDFTLQPGRAYLLYTDSGASYTPGTGSVATSGRVPGNAGSGGARPVPPPRLPPP